MRRLILVVAATLLFAAPASADAWHHGETGSSELSYSGSNWSGYVAHDHGVPFTGASGTLNVPDTQGGVADGATAIWVGVDGFDADYLLQAGVMIDGSGVLTVWYVDASSRIDELDDYYGTAVPLDVAVGDQVTVALARVKGDEWNISIANVSTGVSWSTLVSYSGPGDTSEWVTEATGNATTDATTGVTTAPQKLIPFSPVTWTGVSTRGGYTRSNGTLDASKMIVGSDAHPETFVSMLAGGVFKDSYIGASDD